MQMTITCGEAPQTIAEGGGGEGGESRETVRDNIYTVHYKVISIIFQHLTLSLYNILSDTLSPQLTKEQPTEHTSMNAFQISTRLEEIVK